MNPSSTPAWLTVEFVLSIHQELVGEFGGSSGVRDQGLLESALIRPQNLFHYSNERNVFRLAASYAYGITSNHPFVDGNKRVSLVACAVFLDLNGHELTAPEAETAVVFGELAAGSFSEEELGIWLERNSEKSA